MKIGKKSIVLLGILGMMTMAGCYYDIEAELYQMNNTACDTTGVTYSNTVAPLMQSQCVSCHSASFASGNIALDTYAAVRTSALNGSLYGSMNYSGGFSPMPQGGNKVNACTLQKIKAWVDAGAPNN